MAHPEQRLAQQTLAREIITDLHGSEEYERAVQTSRKLFAGDYSGMNLKEVQSALRGAPQVQLREGMALADALVQTGICSSKREAREFLANGAISLNGTVVKDPATIIGKALAGGEAYIIIRRGKKKYYLGLFA